MDQVKPLLALAARRAFTLLGAYLASVGLIHGDPSGFVGACMIIAEVGYEGWNRYGMVLVSAVVARSKGVHPAQVSAQKAAASMALFFAIAVAAVMSTLLAVPSHAADMATKAAPQNPFVGTASSAGWYVGLGVEGDVAASNVSGSNFAGITSSNLTAGGGSMGLDVGYIWNNCLLGTWCQLELDGTWQNVAGTAAVGSVNSQYSISEEFDVGAQLVDTITSYLNLNTSFPTFNPTNLLPAAAKVNTAPREYFGFVLDEMNLNGSFGSANGQTWAVAYGPKTGYRWQTLGSNGSPNGGSLNVYAEVLFANRGVTIDNLFAAGGAPISLNSSAEMSTLYRMGVHYDFGIAGK
jgi:hypothetical protein